MNTPRQLGGLALAEALLGPLLAAGEAILRIRASAFTVEHKADASPVTEADRQAEEILLRALATVAPGVPVVAEEEIAAGRCPQPIGVAYFLVDALDGTKEFVRGGDDFTVNVALVENGAPSVGLVGAPARGRAWLGATGNGAFVVDAARPDQRRPIAVRPRPLNGLDIVASRSHRTPETDTFIDRFPGARTVSVGSSLKFCLLAEGGADLYPRMGPTSQWDTAAGDAVLRAAGGRVMHLDGTPFTYRPGKWGEPHPFLNPSFVATANVDPFTQG